MLSLFFALFMTFGTCSVEVRTISAEEQNFLIILNEYRAQNGAQPLAISEALTKAAFWHAYDMAEKGYFSHTDSLGRSPFQRIRDCGYSQSAGENIAGAGIFSTAQSVFNAWKNSPGHDQNMLRRQYGHIGIARISSPYHGWLWVTTFGTGSGGVVVTPTPSPTPTVVPTPTPQIYRMFVPQVARDGQ